MKKIFLRSALVALLLVVSSKASFAAEPFTKDQEQRVRTLLEDALKEKPELIIDALKAYQEKKMAEENVGRTAALGEIKAKLLANKEIAVAGAKTPDVRIIEFFDYNCGYCRHMVPVIQSILKTDKKVQWVFVDLPILGEQSMVAAKFAQAVNKQSPDKFFAFHAAVMGAKSSISQELMEKTAKSLGLDVEKIKKDMANPAVEKHIQDNIAYAAQLKIQGTPALIIGDEFYPGAADEATLQEKIKKVRSGGK
jgi:protein-disulfide isomerase